MLNALRTIAQNMKVKQNGAILVHFWGFNEDSHLFEVFSKEMKLLYKNVVCIHLSDQFVLSSAKSNQLSKELVYGDFDLDKVTTVIDLCRYAPTSLVSQLQDEARGNFISFIRGIFAHATSAGRDFIQLRLPSQLNAEEAGLPYEKYESTWLKLVNIDYRKLEQDCFDKVKDFKGIDQVKILTGNCYELELKLGERNWHIDAGNGDFPAGEIYIAPLENSANGTFIADRIFWEGEVFSSVLLEFQSGCLINCSEKTIFEDLRQEPGDAMKIAEFGIGLNPGYKTTEGITGCALFDEKLYGTCHIAVGMNHLFGGVNDSPVHVDFIASNFEIVYN